MTAPYGAAEILAHNQAALTELERAIRLRPHHFSLILARCNYARLRAILVDHLQKATGAVELVLPGRISTLRQAIAAYRPSQSSPALLISGLEAVQTVENVIKAANLGRDELRKTFTFPLVLWVNDDVLQLINRHAPDLKSVATAPISFDFPPGELVYSLHRGANDLFATMLSLGDDSPYPESAPAYQQGSSLRAELDFALQDIAQNHTALDGELLASLNFLKGRDAFSRGNMDLARFHFEASLEYWERLTEEPIGADKPPSEYHPHKPFSTDIQRSTLTVQPRELGLIPPPPPPREKLAVLLFYLGATWRSLAALQRVVYEESLHLAEECFNRCLDVFRAEARWDLLGKFIHALAEVYEKQEAWEALRTLALEGIALHRSDPVRLARNYGYLAEVALVNEQPQTAKYHAERALEILNIADAVQPNQGGAYTFDLGVADQFQKSWYLYLLARVEIALGHIHRAITLLEAARHQTQPKQDLVLYRHILETLQQQYYNQKEYRNAFHIKLEQRQVETRFRLRAFIGAGHIQPYESAFVVVPDGPTQTLLATEIQASGRQVDVDVLTVRLEQPRYPLVIMHGPSGVGKSSILYAGLVPALWRSFPEGRSTLPVLVKSYRDWPEAVHQALAVSLQQQRGMIPDETMVLSAPVSPQTLLEELRRLVTDHYQQVVLLFDQFEEFFVDATEISQRHEFYRFLTDCLDTPYLKVLLSLREDYLHYLLEIERSFDLDIINNDILTRENRYYLGNFRAGDARMLMRRLTLEANFQLEAPLLEQLVTDLSTELGEVRPIELQVVGAQLQRDRIHTLTAYRHLGDRPKEKLVQRFLDNVVSDCGPDNTELANLVLYLLTDADRDNHLYRPQKTREELEEELTLLNAAGTMDQLDLVLEILVGSGLVFIIPDAPTDRYQLVHDYLVSYVRREHIPDLVRQFNRI